MARTSKPTDVVRLTHRNGGAVSVSAEKAERLVAGGEFTRDTPTRTTTAKADDK